MTSLKCESESILIFSDLCCAIIFVEFGQTALFVLFECGGVITDDLTSRAQLKAGIASSNDVSADAVTITGVAAARRRHLLAGGVKVDFKIETEDPAKMKQLKESVVASSQSGALRNNLVAAGVQATSASASAPTVSAAVELVITPSKAGGADIDAIQKKAEAVTPADFGTKLAAEDAIASGGGGGFVVESTSTSVVMPPPSPPPVGRSHKHAQSVAFAFFSFHCY